jgi:mono/diheme cytochrome c family protein
VRLRGLTFALFLLLFAFAAGACESERPVNDPTGARKTIASRCGACHAPPKPGVRARDTLPPVVARHHARVQLTEEQWRAVVDYLAAPADATTPAKLDR